ncbi:MAG: hypothetical protein O3A42_17985, partial [Actinobacteria bacterium]|nr:hypothetical protein [Actinomycetota bacterium]
MLPRSSTDADTDITIESATLANVDSSPSPAAAVVEAVVDPSAAQAPVMTAAEPASSSSSVSGLGGGLLSWLQSGTSGEVPAAAPLMWTALAFSRRELGKTVA